MTKQDRLIDRAKRNLKTSLEIFAKYYKKDCDDSTVGGDDLYEYVAFMIPGNSYKLTNDPRYSTTDKKNFAPFFDYTKPYYNIIENGTRSKYWSR